MQKLDNIQKVLRLANSLQILCQDILGKPGHIFDSISSILSKTVVVCEIVKSLEYDAIDQQNISGLLPELEVAYDSLRDILTTHLDVGDQRSLSHAEALLQKYEVTYAAIVNRVAPWLLLLNSDRALAEPLSHMLQYIAAVETKGQEYRKEWNAMHERLLDIEKLIKERKDEVEEFSKNITVAQYQNVYKSQAHSYWVSANLWLAAVVLLIITIVAGSVYTLLHEGQLAFLQSNNVSVIATRVIIYTTLFLLLNICARNYRANRHNQIVNKHRDNALSSFITFIQSSAEHEPEIRGQILLEVTRTIFSNQNTGYTSSDSDDSPNKIFEIFKNFPTSKP